MPLIDDLIHIYKDLYGANLDHFVFLFKKYKTFNRFVKGILSQQGGDIPVYSNGRFITLPPNLDTYLCLDNKCFNKLKRALRDLNPSTLTYPQDYDYIFRNLLRCRCKKEFIKLLLEIEGGNIKGRNTLYEFLRENFKKEAENLISLIRQLDEFVLQDMVSLIYQILHFRQRQNSAITSIGNLTIVFYPFFSLDFTKSTLKNLEKIAQDSTLSSQIEKIVENLKATKPLPAQSENKRKCVERALKGYTEALTKCLREWANNPDLKLLPEQEKLIRDWVQNGNIYVEGVPGASKTFTGVASLLFGAIVDTTIIFPQAQFFNYLITGNTYKSLKEFIKKLVDFSQCAHFRKFVSDLMKEINCPTDENIGLKGITVYFHISRNEMEKAGAESCEEYIEKLKQEINVKNNSGIKVSCGCGSTNSLCVTIYIPFSNRKGDDGLFFHAAVLRKVIASQGRGFQYINSLHLEEASQIPFASLVEILAALKNSQFFKIAQDPSSWWRFSFSGDPLQLSPIYQRADGAKNLLALGIYYNLFTFFGTNQKLKRVLKTSLRVPKPLIEYVREFYGNEIEALRENCNCFFVPPNVPQSCPNAQKLKKTLEEIANYKGCLLRVEYTLKGNGNFPRPRKYNPVELEIASLLSGILGNCKKCSKAYLTPFRAQERALKGIFEGDCVVVGTVDKLQGDEKDAVFFLTTVEDKDYACDLIDFVFNPNRLNVAITRTKNLFVLIHSSSLGEVAFTEFNEAFEDDIAIFTSSILRKYPNADPSLIRNLLKFLNANEGLFIFQKVISSTDKLLGKFTLNFTPQLKRRGICSPGEVKAEVSVYGA